MLETLVPKNTIEPTDITEDYLSGYHRCCLEQPYHLDYASPDLCSILGYTPLEIHNLFHDKYSKMVYSKDRKRYLHFIEMLASKEQTLSLQYRMVCKDGHIIYMNDTMTSRRLEDGRMYGFAVVADVTDSHNQQVLHDSIIPQYILNAYGFLQCTCEKYPKVLHVNAQMLHKLGVTEESANWQDFLKENIFFMVPFEERDMFRGFLDAAKVSTEPINIEHHLLCSDGSSIPVTGWLSVTENDFEEPEFVFIYMCTDNSSNDTEKSLDNSYFYALKSAYNIIFELNLDRQTVECIHGRETSLIGALYDVHMTIESAKNFWLNNYVFEEDRGTMGDFLKRITAPSADWNDSTAMLTEFRILWTDHVIHKFLGVAVRPDASTVLLCCRDISKEKYTSLPTQEAIALNKLDHWIDYSVSQNRPSAGVLLVEEADHERSLLYVSKGIRNYMELSKSDYLHYIAGEYPLEQFLETAAIPLEVFDALLKKHSAHWVNDKADPDQPVFLTATCCVHDSSGRRLYEIIIQLDSADTNDFPATLKPSATLTEQDIPASTPAVLPFSSRSKKRIFARTFGHFDLFVDGTPVNFSSSKEKELMALLIDRNGGTLTASDAISRLWEDEAATDRISGKYRKLAMGLKNTLTRYGIEYILINNHGTRSLDKSAIKCDYYELLSGNEKYKEAFHNAYMTDYSWAEETLATLWDYS